MKLLRVELSDGRSKQFKLGKYAQLAVMFGRTREGWITRGVGAIDPNDEDPLDHDLTGPAATLRLTLQSRDEP